MSKLPPIDITIEREVLKRDAAAKWLAKHDGKRPRGKRRTPPNKRKGGARS